jgi:DNA-binding transcriptional LysR family regulator
MDIERLKYFISVAHTLNFSEAARRNGLTQAAISYHISELEKELNCKLFLRSKRNVVITPAGQMYLPFALEMVELNEKASYRLRQYEEGKSGSISICGVRSMTPTLRECLTVFGQRHPDVQVEISFTSARDQVLSMRKSRHDFHFASDDQIPLGGLFSMIKVRHAYLCLAVHRDHPLAKRNEPDLELLKGDRYISVEDADSPMLSKSAQRFFQENKFRPASIWRCDSPEAVGVMVSSAMGFGVLPDSMCDAYPDTTFIPLISPTTARTEVVAWKTESANPAARSFLDVLMDLYGQNGLNDGLKLK